MRYFNAWRWTLLLVLISCWSVAQLQLQKPVPCQCPFVCSLLMAAALCLLLVRDASRATKEVTSALLWFAFLLRNKGFSAHCSERIARQNWKTVGQADIFHSDTPPFNYDKTLIVNGFPYGYKWSCTILKYCMR